MRWGPKARSTTEGGRSTCKREVGAAPQIGGPTHRTIFKRTHPYSRPISVFLLSPTYAHAAHMIFTNPNLLYTQLSFSIIQILFMDGRLIRILFTQLITSVHLKKDAMISFTYFAERVCLSCYF